MRREVRGRLTRMPPPARHLVALALVAAGLGAAPAAGTLGTNLAGITYYDGVVPFSDLVRQSGDWVPQQEGGAWGAGPPLSLRADGWPTRLRNGQYATLPVAETRYPAGTYRVTWKGEGAFDVNGTEFAGRAGRGSVRLDGASLVLLNIRATDPANPLRAVRIIAPGERRGSMFRGAYLRSLAPYRAMRFMDWQRANGTFDDPVPAHSCATRVRPGSVSQGQRKGASVEVMVALANATRADPWFVIPHTADASWVRCHARYVARALRPRLTARYEFSNETWNPAFVQFHDLTNDARRNGLGDDDSFLGLQQEVARRSAAAMRIVRAEFSRRGRTPVRVMAGQAANSFVLEQRMSFGDSRAHVDEIAIAPYAHVAGANAFDAGEARSIVASGLTGVFAGLQAALDAEVAPWTSAHRALASRFGVGLSAYEGGQHLAGDSGNADLTTLFIAANRDPRMGRFYDAYLARWRALTDGALFMHFTDAGPYSRFGSWGAREHPEQPPAQAPKLAALLRYAAAG